ncbi:hypothetical protein DVH24_035586 [Malus domestica]|uniref:Uncharacterized protein n=1 Tax=Malus domestica TaxID=3750 RepID=A0A498JMF3_MALDO|nr:hypothetical protein DVH24_035586 [Malus domestica]
MHWELGKAQGKSMAVMSQLIRSRKAMPTTPCPTTTPPTTVAIALVEMDHRTRSTRSSAPPHSGADVAIGIHNRWLGSIARW